VDDLTSHLLHARDGDTVAFAAAVRLSQAEVWRLCAHLVGRDLADDVTQDTYARAVTALPTFRAASSGRTWLLSIARHACADAVRRAIRRRRRDEASVHHPDGADPSASVALTSLLVGLDPDQRAAFVLTQLHGLSYSEAAEVCGVPIGTIRSRVARARSVLVAALRDAEAQ
jgi:RNA polymerase sigma-70 factor (ECF subfamily)